MFLQINVLEITGAKTNAAARRIQEQCKSWCANTWKGSLSYFLILAQIIGTVPSFSKLNSLLTQSQLPSRLTDSEAALGSVEMCFRMLGSAAGNGR